MRTLLEYKHFMPGKCSYHETCTHIHVRLSCDYYLALWHDQAVGKQHWQQKQNSKKERKMKD